MIVIEMVHRLQRQHILSRLFFFAKLTLHPHECSFKISVQTNVLWYYHYASLIISSLLGALHRHM